MGDAQLEIEDRTRPVLQQTGRALRPMVNGTVTAARVPCGDSCKTDTKITSHKTREAYKSRLVRHESDC